MLARERGYWRRLELLDPAEGVGALLDGSREVAEDAAAIGPDGHDGPDVQARLERELLGDDREKDAGRRSSSRP